MTDIQTILLSQLNRNLVGAEMAKDIDDVLIDRIRVAKQEYRSIPRSALVGEVEEKRFHLLNRISMLQSETFFKISNDSALVRMIPNILIPYLIDQGAAAYEARNERDLNVLEFNLGQFQTVLDKAITRTVRRSQARSYGIFGCIGALFVIGSLIWYGNNVGLDKNWIMPIVSVPVTVVLWSLIGSLAAMLYRFNRSSDSDLEDPLRWLFTRPLTGMVMGMIVYLMIKGTLIVSDSQLAIGSLGSQEVIWLVAFLAGFSDRFSDFVLNLIVGRLGAAASDQPSSTDAVRAASSHMPSHRTIDMLDDLSHRRQTTPVEHPLATRAAEAPQPRAVEPKVTAPETRAEPLGTWPRQAAEPKMTASDTEPITPAQGAGAKSTKHGGKSKNGKEGQDAER